MKPLFRLVINTFGYGSVLNQLIDLCLISTFQKRETCLLLKSSLDLLLTNMENKQYTEGGTLYPQAYNFMHLKPILHSSL